MTGTNLGRLSECRDCHDPIRFVQLATGGRVPVNPRPGDTGSIAARRVTTVTGPALHGYAISAERPPAPDTHPLRFVVHHATCAERRPTKPTAPAAPPAEPLF